MICTLGPGKVFGESVLDDTPRYVNRIVTLTGISIARGGSRGRVQGLRTPTPPPWDEAFFFVFAFKICLRHQSVTPFLSGAPRPKRNPGSAPDSPVHTTPKKLETGVFTLKTHQMFSNVHTTLENAAITGNFEFVFEENSVREITWLLWCHRFRKAPFSKCFPSTRKREDGVFKFLRFEAAFPKSSVFVTD